ncbi:DUF348 domain-containing protein [Paenisporosarcina cavernae]|uniref:DUF348 domain-containing protein n=2 Tax=Paenisporosarcina cavernae TaxID=2320858 RepID=A0A385YX72_9BACL|nr:DUF348 domain-containing protein [Paenisporosarcina cavernae]
MKNLFSTPMRKNNVSVLVTAIVFIIAIVAGVFYVSTQQTVALSVNGQEKEVQTHANTVGELLEEENIAISSGDYLSPSLSTKIEDGISIKWEQARNVAVNNDGTEMNVLTTADTVKEVLADANITVSEHDEVSPSLNSKVGENTEISFKKAFEVTLLNGTEKQSVWSTSTTVADFLKQQEITLNEFDRVEQKLEELVIPNDTIQVVRVEKVTDVVEAETNFATETKKDKNILKGQEKVVQAGEKGKIARTIEIIKENGKAVSRSVVSEKVLKEPTKKVVAVGTKVMTASVSRSNAPSTGRTVTVSSTAYTAYCNGCSGVTATGINLRANPDLKVIAVDPSVIPLGSKVWVEGYGYAIAGDTGGAIKGHKIDLFMPTTSQALSYGRKTVTVKILN